MIEKLLNNYMEVFKNFGVNYNVLFLSYSTYTDLKKKNLYEKVMDYSYYVVLF